MEVRCGGFTFLFTHGQWFVHDVYWRPATRLEWTGTEFRVPTLFADPMNPVYGFGSEAMKEYCESLDAPEEVEEKDIWIGTPEWFFDRPVVLSPCAPRTLDSWKRMNVKHRTFRSKRGKAFTKRNWK